MTPKMKVLLAVTGLSLALDQATKVWTQQAFDGPRDKLVVIPNWLDFVHAENPGAAFSFMADVSPIVRFSAFAAFTVVAVVALLQMFAQLGANERLRAASIGLILSGALGNGIDRAYKQSVTDFVKMYWGPPGAVRDWLEATFHTNVWPVWNIADAVILIGVGMFVLEYLFEKDHQTTEDVGDNPIDRQDDASASA